ncbi:MAG: transcriptional regulator [Spirochaetales bacterium]|nr:transcriptional regulator [Spirochaetales bacterium]
MQDMDTDDTFNKARIRALLSKLGSIITKRKDDLIPFSYAYSMLKPSSEAYRGIKHVPLSHIVGSEGRYKDFNRVFLPRGTYLRERWERINKAYKVQIELPPVRLYEIGGVYFVRDGNHRISVALSRGVEFIDAEVTSLETEIKLDKDMSKEDLKHIVIGLEKKKFYKETKLKKLKRNAEIDFTAPGRYDELLDHIQVHKYFINMDKQEEIPYAEAVVSWYDNVYQPIVRIIEEENILSKFPERTSADLYIWMVRYWDGLKRKYGQDYPSEKAVKRYSQKYGKSVFEKIKNKFTKVKNIFRR